MNAHPEVIRQVLARESRSSGAAAFAGDKSESANRACPSFYFGRKVEGWTVTALGHLEYKLPKEVKVQDRFLRVIDGRPNKQRVNLGELFEQALDWIAAGPDYTVEGFHRVVSRRR